jgi:hypothetical protein
MDKFMGTPIDDPLVGLSERDREIMRQLLRRPHEPQKAAPKAATPKGVAQRRRRENERQQRPNAANDGG